MSTRVKRRLILGVLALLVVWPLVHYGLSRRYHINHWRFAGFAMYTRPADQPRLAFSGRVGDRPLTPDALRAALGDEVDQVDAFVARRRLWGELAKPEDLGALILERMPDLRDLVVVINTLALEPGADYLSHRAERYRCVRPSAPGDSVCTRF